MRDKIEHSAAQGELRQRRAKLEVQHVKRRLEKNEVRTNLFFYVYPNPNPNPKFISKCYFVVVVGGFSSPTKANT